MNEDAFARRFYADRSELEALGIVLAVEKPVDGQVEQETYSLPPENFHLPAIEFTDKELAALRTALQLLDGEFAYAEPLRLALQQISWGRPSPLTAARAAHRRARNHRLRRRPRRLPAPRQDRDRDLPPQDDRVRLLHDGARRAGDAPRRSLPAALPGRPVLPRRPRPRTRRDPGLPALPDPRQGRLRDQGRARLPAAQRVRSAYLRGPDRLAVRRSGGGRRGLDQWPDRVADRAPFRPLRRGARGGRRRRPGVHDAVRQLSSADRLGARARRERPDPQSSRARRRGA